VAGQGDTPTLYEWAGGREAFERLTGAFYDRVDGRATPPRLVAWRRPYRRNATNCPREGFARDRGPVGSLTEAGLVRGSPCRAWPDVSRAGFP